MQGHNTHVHAVSYDIQVLHRSSYHVYKSKIRQQFFGITKNKHVFSTCSCSPFLVLYIATMKAFLTIHCYMISYRLRVPYTCLNIVLGQLTYVVDTYDFLYEHAITLQYLIRQYKHIYWIEHVQYFSLRRIWALFLGHPVYICVTCVCVSSKHMYRIIFSIL